MVHEVSSFSANRYHNDIHSIHVWSTEEQVTDHRSLQNRLLLIRSLLQQQNRSQVGIITWHAFISKVLRWPAVMFGTCLCADLQTDEF
jgi:hypothetical protein